MSRTEELKKEIKELEDKIKSLQQELINTQKTEFDYPFNHTDDCYRLEINGCILKDWWSHSGFDQRCYKQGNIFKTQKEALREHCRRELLMRFKQFRDKCNGDWKPDFKDNNLLKHYINFNHQQNRLKIYPCWNLEEFNLFGYFKNESDAERAIELFGDEIKRLFVEVA
nr:MAG TPA: zipper dimerization domain transcription factor-like protein [Caudoviricetes sp.]